MRKKKEKKRENRYIHFLVPPNMSIFLFSQPSFDFPGSVGYFLESASDDLRMVELTENI